MDDSEKLLLLLNGAKRKRWKKVIVRLSWRLKEVGAITFFSILQLHA